MKTIIETTQLEFDKSDFLIDLVKHENGLFYVEIIQNIIGSKNEKSSIKINPTVLTDIIKVLQNYQAKIPNKSGLRNKHITDLEQQKIQERYLKGISINDLAMQFDQTPELIKMILTNKGIEIVGNKLHRSKFWRNNYSRKKKKNN